MSLTPKEILIARGVTHNDLLWLLTNWIEENILKWNKLNDWIITFNLKVFGYQGRFIFCFVITFKKKKIRPLAVA